MLYVYTLKHAASRTAYVGISRALGRDLLHHAVRGCLRQLDPTDAFFVYVEVSPRHSVEGKAAGEASYLTRNGYVVSGCFRRPGDYVGDVFFGLAPQCLELTRQQIVNRAGTDIGVVSPDALERYAYFGKRPRKGTVPGEWAATLKAIGSGQSLGGLRLIVSDVRDERRAQ